MKNSDFESIEKKALSDKEINSITDSEKTEEEIIYNHCISEDEEEFLDTENKVESDVKNLDNLKSESNNDKSKLQSNNNQSKNHQNNLTNIQTVEPKSRKNKFQSYYSPKFDFAKKKRKKNEEKKTADDLFNEAFKKNFEKNSVNNNNNNEYDKEGNTMSTKISDIIYKKYVEQNNKKINTVDVVISTMRDEEMNLNKETLRSKDDSKKINSMITRQEIFQKKKISNLKNKEKELNDKLNQECIFVPNSKGKSSNDKDKQPRTIDDFNESQKKFLEDKKKEIIKIYKEVYEDKNKNKKVVLTSKQSEKIALAKNPNESKEQMYDRLHFEKLKNLKENYDKPKEEKKMTKKEINNLSDKLYKEGIKFKENKDKLTKEKLKKEIAQEDHISDNSNKVVLSKFLNYYQKILKEIFNRSDNFQINIDEYKIILNNMGCINPNLQSDEILIKESFFNILNPKDDKINTDSLLLFCLAALGIYKGNEELKKKSIIPQSADKHNKDKSDKIQEIKNNRISLNKINTKKNEKPKIKTINEILISSLPKIDFKKNGFSSKIAKNIKLKFHHFIKGITESWSEDISKKKQERREKLQMSYNKIPKSHSKNKKSLNKDLKNTIVSNKSKNLEPKENNSINKKLKNKSNTINTNSNKYDEIYNRLQSKKYSNINNIKALQKKKEEDELALCTFQPNINRISNSNSKNKNINKNQNKANKKQIQNNYERLYQEGKAAYLEKRRSIDPDPEDNLENKINCTFKPKINKFNNEVFINNPIKDDIQKLEKIGLQKMNQRGSKEYSKPMNFYIESKLNKEDIVDRVVPERNSVNTKNDNIDRDSKTALLKVEVNLDENNTTDKIVIFPGDDVIEKTLQFCTKHKLSEEKKNTLLNVIFEKIEENQNIERPSDNNNLNNNNNIIEENIKEENKKIFELNNKDNNENNNMDNKEQNDEN